MCINHPYFQPHPQRHDIEPTMSPTSAKKVIKRDRENVILPFPWTIPLTHQHSTVFFCCTTFEQFHCHSCTDNFSELFPLTFLPKRAFEWSIPSAFGTQKKKIRILPRNINPTFSQICEIDSIQKIIKIEENTIFNAFCSVCSLSGFISACDWFGEIEKDSTSVWRAIIPGFAPRECYARFVERKKCQTF